MKPLIMKCPNCGSKVGLVTEVKKCPICETMIFRK